MRLQKIVSIRRLGHSPVRDIEVDHPDHNFIANGVVVSNSHSYCYAYLGYICMWLKTNFKLEWWNAVLQNSSFDDLRDASKYISDIVVPPDVNVSDLAFYIIKEDIAKLVFPIDRIKNVKGAGAFVVEARKVDGVETPFTSIEDFYHRVNRTKVNKRVVAALIWSGAFDNLYPSTEHGGRRNEIYRKYLAVKKDSTAKTFVDLTPLQIVRIQMSLLAIGDASIGEILKDYTGLRHTPLHEALKLDDKTVVRVGGLIAAYRKVATKTGKNPGQQMAIIDIENDGVTAAVTVFPSVFETYEQCLAEGNVVSIKASINTYKGKKGLCAETIINIVDDFEKLNTAE